MTPRNASEARALLRNKRGVEQLSRNVDRNTKAVYVSDDMVTLRFHKTDVAAWLPDGVRLDTRANADDPHTPTENGHWFTNTTWERIGSWTPFSTFKQRGLTYVCAKGDWSNARLYIPGITMRTDGEIDPDTAMIPELESHVRTVVGRYPSRLKRYAGKLVERWLGWESVPDCCAEYGEWSEGATIHALQHFEANEVVIPRRLNQIAEAFTHDRSHTRASIVPRLHEAAQHLFKPLMPLALSRAVPEFPYPQATPRRT